MIVIQRERKGCAVLADGRFWAATNFAVATRPHNVSLELFPGNPSKDLRPTTNSGAAAPLHRPFLVAFGVGIVESVDAGFAARIQARFLGGLLVVVAEGLGCTTPRALLHPSSLLVCTLSFVRGI